MYPYEREENCHVIIYPCMADQMAHVHQGACMGCEWAKSTVQHFSCKFCLCQAVLCNSNVQLAYAIIGLQTLHSYASWESLQACNCSAAAVEEGICRKSGLSPSLSISVLRGVKYLPTVSTSPDESLNS